MRRSRIRERRISFAPTHGAPRSPWKDCVVNRSRLITIALVVIAVVIAWVLVNLLLGVLVFVAKLALVAVVAALVYVVIRYVLRATDDD